MKAFIKKQKKKAKSRLLPKSASKITDQYLRRLLRKVRKSQSRNSISKLQAALKRKRAGSVKIPIRHHKVVIHPRTPRRKKNQSS